MRASSTLLAAAVFVGVIAFPVPVSLNRPSLSRTAAAATGSGVPRTPWGDPDLQGDWTSQGELGVPFERPTEFGTRQELSDEEFAKAADRLRAERDRDNAEFELETADRSNAGAVGSATSPPPHWLERGNPSRRTSMVIDPPDGRVPPITAEARARQQRQVRGSFGNGPFNGPTDFTLYDRCITRGMPGSMFPAVYNANTRIVQGPGFVAITYEMIHETRIIPVDGRDHVVVGDSPVPRRFSWPLGRRHARRRRAELQRCDELPRRRPESASGRALHARGRQRSPLRGHRRGRDDVREAVDGGTQSEDAAGGDVRIRVPRRQPRDVQHAERCARGGEGRRRFIDEMTTAAC